MRVYLNIGSNIGDRQGFIDAAIEAIEREFCCHALRSDVVESEPWGFASSNRFLNIGIALSIADCEPHELLRRLKAIESGIDSRSHRTADGGYADISDGYGQEQLSGRRGTWSDFEAEEAE